MVASESHAAGLVLQPLKKRKFPPVYFLPFGVLYLIILPVQQIFTVSHSPCQTSLCSETSHNFSCLARGKFPLWCVRNTSRCLFRKRQNKTPKTPTPNLTSKNIKGCTQTLSCVSQEKEWNHLCIQQISSILHANLFHKPLPLSSSQIYAKPACAQSTL